MIYRLRDIFNVQPDKLYWVLWTDAHFELCCLHKIWHRNEFTVVLHHFFFYRLSVSICKEGTRTGEVQKLDFCPILAWCTTSVAQLSQIIFASLYWATHYNWGTGVNCRQVSLVGSGKSYQSVIAPVPTWNVFVANSEKHLFTKIIEVDKIKCFFFFFIRMKFQKYQKIIILNILRKGFLNMSLVCYSPSSAVKNTVICCWFSTASFVSGWGAVEWLIETNLIPSVNKTLTLTGDSSFPFGFILPLFTLFCLRCLLHQRSRKQRE